MARGSQNGISNNPSGKPSGTVNKISLSVKERIIDAVNKDFDGYMIKLSGLPDKDYVRCMTELLKLVVPRPLNEEEFNAMNVNAEIIKRLFN